MLVFFVSTDCARRVVYSSIDIHLFQVWAAGFTTALLKKRSSSASTSTEAGEVIETEAGLCKTQQNEPWLIETMLLIAFEKLFSFLLNLPDVNE